MAMTKEQYEALPEEVQALCTVNDGGEYVLDAVRKSDVSGLATHKDKLLAEKKRIAEEKEALRKQLDEIENQRLTEQQDFKTLAEKAKADKEASEKALAEYKATIEKEKLESKTMSIASKLFGQDADLFAHHVRAKLKFNDSGAVIGFDSTSEMSIEALEESLKQDERLKRFIVASGASGGGANGNRGAQPTTKKLSEMTLTERSILANTNPAEYERLEKLEKGA